MDSAPTERGPIHAAVTGGAAGSVTVRMNTRVNQTARGRRSNAPTRSSTGTGNWISTAEVPEVPFVGDDEPERIIFHTDRGFDFHRERVHRAVPTAEHSAVHGPCRIMLRQRRGRGVLLFAGVEVRSRRAFRNTGQAQAAVLLDWVLPGLQPRSPAQLGGNDEPGRPTRTPRPPIGKPQRVALRDSRQSHVLKPGRIEAATYTLDRGQPL